MFHRFVCKILAIVLVPYVLAVGCSLGGKGSSGDLRQNVFLEAEGCLAENPDSGQMEPKPYSFDAPFGVSLMEASLEVLRGEIDLVVGTEDPPSDYFAFGRGTGTQKILVGSDSREPVGERLRPWYVQLVSPFAIQEGCEVGQEPDWRLTVRRSSGIQGRVVHEQGGEVPARSSETIQIEVPEDALSMEFVLESLKVEGQEEGDSDLLVGTADETESLVSLNPGTGYDAVVLDSERCVPLRGQSLFILLESWQQPTKYSLKVTYTPGEPEEQPPL